MTAKATPYKLNSKYLPLLIPGPDKGTFQAKLVGESGKETILQLDEGATVRVPTKDLGIKMGSSPSGWVYFDKAGVVTNHVLDPVPKPQRSTSGGSTTARPLPSFN